MGGKLIQKLISSDTLELPLTFISRLLIFYLLFIRGLKILPGPFLPFLPFPDISPPYPLFPIFLNMIYWISIAGILINFQPKRFSLVLGLELIFVILSNRILYSTSLLFTACIFFLIGLYSNGNSWIFRAQIALLYLGAGINKLLNPDWITGQFFDNFSREIFEVKTYQFIAPLFSDLLIAKLMGFSVIITELLLGILILFSKKRIFSIVVLIHLFHLFILLFTNGDLSISFFFIMAVNSLLCLPWKKRSLEIAFNENNPVLKFLRKTDFDSYFIWKKTNNFTLETTSSSGIETGPRAFLRILFYHKAAYAILILSIIYIPQYFNPFLNKFISLFL